VDFQHQLALAAHHFTWGLNYRRTDNRNSRKVIFEVDPPQATDTLYGGFIQDQISLGDSVQVTVGTKLEENDFSGFEVQPSARLAWHLPDEQTVWASVSRAVRVPTRLERDVSIEITPGSDPTLWLLGNRDFDAERLLAWELGYRWQASPQLSLDVASFLSRYRGLSSLEIGDSFVDPDDGRTVFPVRNENLTNGRAAGGELLVTFAPRTDWRLTGSYAYVDVNINPRGQDNNRGQFLDGATPRHQIGLRSAFDLGDWQVDAFVRHLSRIRREPQIVTGEGIPGYTELDLRIAYLKGAAEFALVGQNLLHDEHVEFGSPDTRGGIERAVHASVTWRLRTD
jgi:iron complex outermembrane receptor protein